MKQCGYIKGNGERCKGAAHGQHGLCWSHDPDNAGERRRTASKGGRAKADREIRVLKEEIKALIKDVRSGEADRSDATAMFQGYRVLRDYIQLERDVSMIPELTDRLEALKDERRHAG